MEIELEKEKIKYQHKLETKRLILEKLLFAVLMIVIAFIVNLIIENYRSHLTEQRFILEKRFEGVNEVRNAFGKMHDTFMDFTLALLVPSRTLPENYSEGFLETINNYISVGNRWGVVFSPEYNKELENYLWIYQCFYYKDIAKCCVYRSFASDLHLSFNSVTRKELGLLYENQEKEFRFIELSFKEAEAVGADVFFDRNYEQWKQHHK